MKIKASKILILSAIFSLLVAIPAANASTFIDVPYTHPQSDAISFLQSNEVVQGYEDNTFRPDNLINRVEYLKIVIEGTNVPLDSDNPTGFSDVDENQWYIPYIRKAKDEGWIQGYPDGTFRPLNPINKVEALKILGEVQQWDMLALAEVPQAAYKDTYRFSWYSPYVYFAKENELLFEEIDYLEPSKEITRAYMAEIVYRSIVQKVILYRPYFTAEDKIEEIKEVETPSSYTTINPTYFDNIRLDAPLPNTFYLDEVYVIEGEITNGGSYNEIFAFLAKNESTINNNFIHHIGEINGDRFKIPIVFRDPGTYQLGIIPGIQGESNITPVTILDGIPPEGESTNAEKPDGLDINFVNDATTVDWNNTNNNVFRVYFYQDDTVHSYFVRDENDLDIFYKDFKNFEEGNVKWRVYGAKASSLEPLELETKWNQSSDYSFEAVTHHYQLSIDESISYTNIPELLPSKQTISVSGTTQENIFTDGAVITPNGLIDHFTINTTAALLQYYGNDVISAGSIFSFAYNPVSNGVYILEINNQSGSAVLNIPVYIGDIIPLIPDFFDLQDPFEEIHELNLDATRNELLNYINVERAVHGLQAVSLRSDLNQLAQVYSDEITQYDFFSHIDIDGGTPDSRRIDMGIRTDVGENLAHAPSIFFAHQALMRSAIHRGNILNPDWDQLGLGITLDGEGDLIVVEEFSHHIWSEGDLINFENQLLDKINNTRSTAITINSTLVDIARDWSQDMINQNFFSFTAPSGINLIEVVQSRGITNEGRAYILKEGTLDLLFNKLMKDSDIELIQWKKAGIGVKMDDWSNLYVTVLYTE
ncbi:S-layer homology domain-containing protein [Patescibacteria group bacterium]